MAAHRAWAVIRKASISIGRTATSGNIRSKGISTARSTACSTFCSAESISTVEGPRTIITSTPLGLDYAAGILPALAKSATAHPAALPPLLFGTPFYRNDADDLPPRNPMGFSAKPISSSATSLKLTLGLRYNHDQQVRSRAHNLPCRFNSADRAESAVALWRDQRWRQRLNYGALDFDATMAGAQPFTRSTASASRN